MFTEQQEKWLARVEGMFFNYGIKGLTMDDVARELGISKKTLYQFVENKNDLVLKVVERHIEADKKNNACIHEIAGDALDEMFAVIKHVNEEISRIKSNIVYEMQKYHHEAWEKMQEYQRGYLHSVVRDNLERGISEGLYRENFNIDVVAKIHVAESFMVFDESWFPRNQYPLEALFREFLLYYLHGIVSEKGLLKLKTKLS
ncbi:MAG: TetR/AcrR family transcriptional regulator [Saprospiraceae bacterium]|nr:TetR/AcrR family transcriptional regulator [Saprospiraceae bacterium]